jgi:hypothetical protein
MFTIQLHCNLFLNLLRWCSKCTILIFSLNIKLFWKFVKCPYKIKYPKVYLENIYVYKLVLLKRLKSYFGFF